MPSEPTPQVTPEVKPSPLNDKWAVAAIILAIVSSWIGPFVMQPKTVTVTTTTPAVSPQPAKPVTVEPAKPIVPESYILTDKDGKRADAAFEQAASKFVLGEWTLQAIPKPGEIGFTRKIYVIDGTAPRPPTPTVPVVDPIKPNDPPPPPSTPVKVDRVTYVYEKDDGTPPPGVAAAISKLNKEGVLATNFEEDTKDLHGNTPGQYRIALDAAKKAGLPALVVQAGATVVRVSKPKTEQETLEASK